MNSKTLERLNYFMGKVCSILTSPVNRQFDELRAREHFVIRVREITSDGIWGTHPSSQMVSFFPAAHIIGIAEEIELDPNNPEHAQMMQEYEQHTGQKVQSDIQPTSVQKEAAPEPEPEPDPDPDPDPDQVPFVDITNLEKLAAQTKSQYDQSDRLSRQ